MSELLQCPSCGGINQLPEGKNSMFCAFCGNALEKNKPNETIKEENLIKSKPKIKDNCLTLKNRKLKSLKEVSSWFSDDELEEIKTLDLSDNNISSLEGIESFSSISELNLTNNKFNDLSEDDIERINNINIGSNDYGFKLYLVDNNISSDTWVTQIDVDSILSTYKGEGYMHHASGEFGYHTSYNLVTLSIFTDNAEIDEYHPKSDFNPKNKGQSKVEGKSGCFIATAAVGSYDHPQVIELRHFRDEWILEKSWGESFVKLYYFYGAIAAKFIEKSFVLRKLSYLLIVKPLVFLSRIVNSK